MTPDDVIPFLLPVLIGVAIWRAIAMLRRGQRLFGAVLLVVSGVLLWQAVVQIMEVLSGAGQ